MVVEVVATCHSLVSPFHGLRAVVITLRGHDRTQNIDTAFLGYALCMFSHVTRYIYIILGPEDDDSMGYETSLQLMLRSCCGLLVLRHLSLFGLVSAFLVKGDVIITAIQDRLVRSQRLADLRKRSNNPKSQPLPLNGLIDSDILDVTHEAEAAEELVLHEQRSRGDDLIAVLGQDGDDDIRRRERDGFGGCVDLAQV